MSAGETQGAGDPSGAATGPEAASPPDGPVRGQSTGWKFIAAWVAFAITLLLTLWLGVDVVLSTRALG